MKKLFIGLVILFLPSIVDAQTNPCNNPQSIQSAAINITTATTTNIITGPTVDRAILICNFTLSVVGGATANTVQFTYGSGATCGTGTVNLTGPMSGPPAAALTPFLLSPGANNPFKQVPTNNNICIITTQALSVAGVVNYAFN